MLMRTSSEVRVGQMAYFLLEIYPLNFIVKQPFIKPVV